MSRFLVLLAVLVSWPALAHVTSGLSAVEVDGGKLSYRVTLVATDQEGENGRLLVQATDGDATAAEQVASALRRAARFSIGGEACTPGRIALQGSRAGDGKVVLDMALSCPKSTGSLVIRDDWPDVLGSHHQTLMTVRLSEQRSVALTFNTDRREATVDLRAGLGTDWLSFIAMGAEHILSGADHLLFLIALLALAKGVWPIVRIVTGFTLAHSITLSLAVLGYVDVPSRIVEPLIAASIVWVAMENLLAPTRTRWRWLVAALFGLVHGLGFASALTELGLPQDALVRALVGFNLGVELGQLAFVAVVMPAVIWLARPGRVPQLPRALSMMVAAMGAVWLADRILV
ncbi:MAG TPA: HupE/UreJ family protein [Reyranella sp.]|nr:HupE/UreJ family protein [Reyranella sp.]